MSSQGPRTLRFGGPEARQNCPFRPLGCRRHHNGICGGANYEPQGQSFWSLSVARVQSTQMQSIVWAFFHIPRPLGGSKSRSTMVISNLHHRSSRIQNWRFYLFHPRGGSGSKLWVDSFHSGTWALGCRDSPRCGVPPETQKPFAGYVSFRRASDPATPAWRGKSRGRASG